MLLVNEDGKFSLACSPKGRLRGLIGRKKFQEILVLAPCSDVHTVGMSTPIDIAFVGPSGTVLKSCRGVKPRRRVRCRGASAVMERAAKPNEPWPREGSRLVMGFEPQRK